MKQSLLVFLALASLSIAAPAAKYHAPLDSYGRRDLSGQYYCQTRDCTEANIPEFRQKFTNIISIQLEIAINSGASRGGEGRGGSGRGGSFGSDGSEDGLFGSDGGNGGGFDGGDDRGFDGGSGRGSGGRYGRNPWGYSPEEIADALAQEFEENNVAANGEFAETLGGVLERLLKEVGYLVEDIIELLQKALEDLGIIIVDLLDGLGDLLGGLLRREEKRGLNIGAGVNVLNLAKIGADIGLGKDGLSVGAKADILGIKADADVNIGRKVDVDRGLGIPGVEDVDAQVEHDDVDVDTLVQTASESTVFVAVFGDKSGDAADKICHSIVDRCQKDDIKNDPTVILELLLNAIAQILASIKHGEHVEVDIDILIAEAFKLVGGSLQFEDSFVKSLVADVKVVISSLQIEVKVDVSSIIDLVIGTVDSVDLKDGRVHGLIGGDHQVPEISVDVFVNVLVKNLLNVDVFVGLFGGDYDLCSNYAGSIAQDVGKYLDQKDYHLNLGLAAAIAVQVKTVIVKGGFKSEDVSEVVIVVIEKALTAVKVSHDVIDSCTTDLKGSFGKYSHGDDSDDSKYDDSKYDDSKYDDSKYDDSKYDDSKYDDSKYDDSKYGGHGSGYKSPSYSGHGDEYHYRKHGSGYKTSSYSGEHGYGYESSPSYSAQKGGEYDDSYGSKSSPSYSSPKGYKH